VSSFYPGLELATTGVHWLTGLPLVGADPGGSAGAIVI
jgi:hypothetical protein